MLLETVADCYLLARELRYAGFALELHYASTEADYLAALEAPLDLILSDNALPAFDAMRALQLLHASAYDIPLIVVTELAGERAAIECVKLGAADFVFKHRPARLRSAVVRALDQRALRAHARAADAALRQSAAINQTVLDSLTAHIAVLDADGVIIAVNQAWERFARANGDVDGTHTGVGINYLQVCQRAADLNSAEAQPVAHGIAAVLACELDHYVIEYPCHAPNEERWFIIRVTPLVGAHTGAVVAHEDITARKRSEEALRESEERFRSAYEYAPIGMALVGLDGRWLQVNRALCDITGYTEPEMLTTTFQAITHPDDLATDLDNMRALVAGEMLSFQMEKRYFHKHGATIWVLLSVALVRDGQRQPRYFVAQTQDITKRKQAERVLRQKTALIQLFQEVAAAANQATSLDQALQTAVDAICTHIGWPVGHVYLPDPSEPGALLPTRIWHLEDAQRFATFRAITEAVRLAPGIGLPGKALASRKPAWIADMNLGADTPRTRVIQNIGVCAGFALPVLLGDQVAAVLEFFAAEAIEPDTALLDMLHHFGTQLGRVVERARAEATMRESETRFRALFEHSPDAIMLIDPHDAGVLWPILECNDLACAMNGYTRAELIGQSVDLLNGAAGNRDERTAYIERLRHAGTIQFETLHRRKDGSFFPIEVVSCLISVAGRELVLGIDRDISERKRAEDALRATEAKYRTLVEQLPAIIYTAEINVQSSTTYISPQIEALLGFSPEEWLANPNLWLEQAHPDDRARLLDTISRVQASDEPTPIEYRSYTRDGRLVWLRDTERVMRDEHGQPLFIQGFTLDITERKQAEAALARYQLLSEHARDIILFLRSDGQVIEANHAALVAYGYTRDELLALSIYDLRPAGAHREVDARLAQVDAAGILYEAAHCRKDGQIFPVEIGSRGDMIEGERVIVSIIRDITDRKRAEEALHASERLYRTLASNFPNGAVVLFDHDLRFTIADGTGLSAFGLTREEMEGRMIWEVSSAELSTESEAYYRAALAGTPHVREIALGERTYVVHTLPMRDERGEIIAGMLMSQDITERKRMEEALIDERALLARRVDERTADLSAANAELARAAILKDEFLASMSHELRTPLNAVLGLSEALQEEVYGPINDRQRRSLHNIAESGRHLLELINDILDLAKIGAGKLELEIEPAAVATICQASLRLIKQLAHAKQLSVELTIDPAATMLAVDARRLKQILVNLLSNAVKFTPAGGSIGLEVVGNPARQAVDLTVWDTGIGIAQDQMPKLFQPFVQLDSRLARQYEGTGLGLALVYRMVELHGGSVSITSELGQGSRFTVALPWHSPNASAPAAAAVVDPPHAPRAASTSTHAIAPPLVLLAEDNEANITLIADYLGTCGYQVVVARNGAEAIARARETRPAIVLMDIQMPGMDGLEATRRMRTMDDLVDLPIIALTALAMPGDRERCLAAGANDYLSKPVSLRGLDALIQQTLQAHSSQQKDHP
jgi:PAS domain S-box-containing protein